jgi:large conductance mechanosensitive channel
MGHPDAARRVFFLRGEPDMLKGFRDFILRGNVIDLAVAVVIGAAFTGVVNAVTKGFITPLIALAGGKADVSGLNVGPFDFSVIVNSILQFLITAAVVYFLIVTPMNRFMARVKRGETGPKTKRKCPECLSEIPLEARRCAFCTSAVPPVTSA